MIDGFTARIPLRRMRVPDDIAKVALFLLFGLELHDGGVSGRRWRHTADLTARSLGHFDHEDWPRAGAQDAFGDRPERSPLKTTATVR